MKNNNSGEMFFLGFLVGIILTICFSVIFRLEAKSVEKAKEHLTEAVKEITNH